MMIPKISVLVPVYKVEPYLQRCIDSVLAQDFQNWEMILVDDGSPDRCPQICDEAARKDPRISVVHKENGGLPSARLAGFERAKGEYLVFLDSDDYLLPNALTKLFDSISIGDYDIVRSRPLRENEKGKRWLETYEMIEGEITDNESYILSLLLNKIAPYLHSAIFKKSLFSSETFQKVMLGKVWIGEDWVANMLISNNVYRYKAITTPTYVYYCNSSSMMSTCILSPKYDKRVDVSLREFYANCSERIKHAWKCKKIAGLITACFVYEIPFNTRWYHEINEFVKNSSNLNEIKMIVPDKYLIMINNRPFFFIYSRLYAFMKFLKNQKGVKRMVISNV